MSAPETQRIGAFEPIGPRQLAREQEQEVSTIGSSSAFITCTPTLSATRSTPEETTTAAMTSASA